jgi:hypothetical protein
MNLTIKDLDVAKDLSCEERAAVHGGFVGQLGPQQGVFANNGGFNFASPVITTQIAPQIATPVVINIPTVTNSAGVIIPTLAL